MIQNTFIYLIGLSGTGKLTIAQELQKIFPSILVDNHLINNVVFSLIDTDCKSALPEKVWENTWAVRKIVLDTIKHLSKPERNFIFTNALVEGRADDALLYQEIVDLAAARGATLLPVRLLISPEEIERRVVSPERRARLKTVDAVAAKEQALYRKVLCPQGQTAMDLEVTDLSATEAAKCIYAELVKRVALSQ